MERAGAAARGDLPDAVGPQQGLYPEPSLAALGVLRELAATTRARVWLVCDHERGDDPYNTWVWTFSPPRSGRPACEAVFACGGDAGRIQWHRDLIGPEPWRVLADDPAHCPKSRAIHHLGLRGASLPTPRTCSRWRALRRDASA